MLETFDWTDGIVMDESQAIVMPALEPRWNLVEAFNEKGAVFGFVLGGEFVRLRRHGVSYPLTTGTRMLSTIRHNRARGTHAVLRMAEIVRAMIESGLSEAEICRRPGMEGEELERLLDRSGMTVRGSAGADGFGMAWVPNRSK